MGFFLIVVAIVASVAGALAAYLIWETTQANDAFLRGEASEERR